MRAPDAVPKAAGAGPAAFWLVGLSTLVLGVLFLETVNGTLHVWSTSASFNHGFAIPPLVAFLIWERRAELSRVAPTVFPWALVLVAAFGCVLVLGRVTSTLIVEQIGLLGLVESLVLAVLGPRLAWRMAFPLFFAWFAIPFGDFLVAPLQDIAARMVVWGLVVSGIPVYADGLMISIPNGDFQVAEECSGLRFLIASAAVGVLGANMLYRSAARRALFVLLSLVLPILANGLRAFGIIMIAHVSDNRIALGVDHLLYGWVLFSIVTGLLILIGWSFREPPAAATPNDRPADPGSSLRAVVGVAVAALIIAVALHQLAGHALARSGATAPVFAVPEPPLPWRLVDDEPADWRPAFQNPDGEARWRFTDGRRQVDVYLAYYARQREGAEVVGHANRLENELWRRAGGGRVIVPVDGTRIEWSQVSLRGRHEQRLAWTTLWVDRAFTAKPWMAKLRQTRAMLFGGEPAAAAVVVSAPHWDDREAAAAAMRDMIAASGGFVSILEAASRAR